MAIQLTVNNQVFSYPENGEQPQWGPDATDWASAVSDVINGLSTPGDVAPSQFQNSAQNVWVTLPGLKFDELSIQGAEISYLVSRATTSPNVTVRELGKIMAVQVSSGNWVFANTSTQTASVDFQIVVTNNVAQVQIFCKTLSGATHQMRIQFSAKSFKLPT